MASVTKHLPGACGGHDVKKVHPDCARVGCHASNNLSRVTCLLGVQLADMTQRGNASGSETGDGRARELFMTGERHPI